MEKSVTLKGTNTWTEVSNHVGSTARLRVYSILQRFRLMPVHTSETEWGTVGDHRSSKFKQGNRNAIKHFIHKL